MFLGGHMFLKFVAGLACVSGLSGCAGQSGPTFANVTYSNQTFSEAGVSLNVSGAANARESNVSVFFNGNGNPAVTIDGATVALARSGQGLFSNPDGRYVMGVSNTVTGGAPTPDVDYYVVHDRVTGNRATIYVDGNKTNPTAIAALPTATYSGATQFLTSGFNWSSGQIDMLIDFGTGDVSGSLTGFNANPSAVLTIDPSKLAGTNVNTTLSSPTLNITQSKLAGRLYGTAADTVAGTLIVETPSASSIGLFGALR